MEKVRVGVIGVGLMGSLFANLASQLPDSELVGVADVVEDRAARLGEALDVPAYVDYHELLAIPGLEAVVVATPDALHREPALAAARLGKHLLIEKPLATTPEHAIEIVDGCRDAGVTLMVAHVLRFDRNYGEAFRAVRNGKLGEVVHLAARRSTYLGDAERLAGRVSISFYLGIHSIDVIQWILGSPVVEVTAISVSQVMRRFHVDDAVLSLLRFENGAIATLENSWIRPRGATSRPIGASLVMMGTEGALQVTPYRETMTLYTAYHAEPMGFSYSFEEGVFGKISSAYRDEFAHFIECVGTQSPPLVSPAQALSAVLVCNAIEQSLRHGTTVRVSQENVFL